MASWEELFQMLEKLDTQVCTLTGLQQEKTAAVLRDDVRKVDDCMKREQVVSLTLRSMDQKRDKLYQDLGLQNRALSALPEQCPEEYRQQAREIAQRVRGHYQIYRSAAEVSRTTLEINLHQIEKLMNQSDAPMPGGNRGMADIRA